MKNKLIGPYIIKLSSGLGFSNTQEDDLWEAAKISAQHVARWKYAGYHQVKEGAYLFSNGLKSYSLKVFNAENKLITHEILAYFEKKIK